MRNYSPNQQRNAAPNVAISLTAGETLSTIRIDLADRKGTKHGTATYTVAATYRSGEVKTSIKSMHDFRRLDNSLKLLKPNFQYKTVLTPEWADELPLSTGQAKDRAENLEKYFGRNSKSDTVFGLLAHRWVAGNKSQFRTTLGAGNFKINGSEPRHEVDKKIVSALGSAYKKSEQQPTRWFFGRSKAGDLAQANYKWEARDNTELTFAASDYVLIENRKTQFEGWWYGQKVDGSKGFFPSNYVKELDEDTLKKRLKPRNTRGPGGANPMNRANTGGSPGFQPSPNAFNPTVNNTNTNSAGRERRLEKDFWIKSIAGYDELKTQGFTLEQQGKHLKTKQKNEVKTGTFVSLHFSAYVWDPQTQQLREFSSSDKLKAPPRGVQSGDAGKSGFKMEFVVGTQTALAGLEEVAMCIPKNTPVRAIMAPFMGYGDVGSPPEIPADCYLVYDLTLEQARAGGGHAPPRNQVFSVGITRNKIQKRDAVTSGAAWASKRFNNNAKTDTQNTRNKYY